MDPTEYQREYRRLHRTKFRKWNKEYYQNNKDVLREQAREYYKKNRRRCVERSKEYYQRNKEKIRKRGIQYRKKNKKKLKGRRQQIRKWLWSLKRKPCMDCNGVFHPCAMDFDHRDPSQKTIGISRTIYHKKRILEEIKKCDLVCANCHRLRTLRQYRDGKIKRRTLTLHVRRIV